MQNTNMIRCMAAALTLTAGVAMADAPESDREIRIALNNWSSQNVSSYVLGTILYSLGYDVEYIQADAMAQFAGLESGDITIQTEIWPTTQGKRLAAGIESGDIVDMGGLGMLAIEEWWYPLYMKEACPGLPDWEALKEPACAAAFSSPQTAPNGRYLGGPADWEGFDDERVEALGLPWTVIHAGSDATMWAELASAYKRKAPIMLWIFSPHWWSTVYEGEYVQFPPYTDECYSDPSWGINPDKAYDCGKPTGELRKTAWSGGADIWPTAYHILGNMTFSDEHYAKIIAQVDIEGQPAQQVAEKWVADNEEIWKSWMN